MYHCPAGRTTHRENQLLVLLLILIVLSLLVQRDMFESLGHCVLVSVCKISDLNQ